MILNSKAFSGEEAMKILEKDSNIEVVILDVKMPGMGSIETLAEIHRKYPLVEVIMLSGHVDVESAIEGMKQGAFDYLMKPVDRTQLLQVLARHTVPGEAGAAPRVLVVEDDDEPALFKVSRVVYSLERHPSRDGPVSHDADDEVVVSAQVAGGRQQFVLGARFELAVSEIVRDGIVKQHDILPDKILDLDDLDDLDDEDEDL